MSNGLIPIKYVGLKPMRPDSVAGTGLVWLPGETHEVEPGAALKLLKHPDVWADARAEEDQAPIEAKAEEKPAEPPKEAEYAPPLVDLNGMSKQALTEFAARELHEELDQKKSVKDLRAYVSDKLTMKQKFGG